MSRQCITIHPYFTIAEGKLEEFKAIWQKMVPVIDEKEPGCSFYEFSFCGNVAFCREGYEDAAGVLTHLSNVGAVLEEAGKISQITRLEVHGPAQELKKLKEPMASLPVEFYAVEFGFRR